MTLDGLDDLDRRVLHALQRDARNASSREVAERAGVSPSTVRKRVARLERQGVVAGYRAEVDYERAGYPFHVQITCTASIRDRAAVCERALAVPGVVGVRELVTGERNVVVVAVGTDGDDLTRIATALGDLGLTVADEDLVQSDGARPFAGFDVADLDPRAGG